MKNKKIICVDLDGVILSYKHGWLGAHTFGKPNPGMKTLLSQLIKDDYWVIIYTCRGDRKKIADTLKKYGICKKTHYEDINRRKGVWEGTSKHKIGADIYIDDRAICFAGNSKKLYKQIKKFKPWQSSN